MQAFARLAIILIFALSSMMMSPDPTRVVFFGDSITEMGADPDGYIVQLRAMLDSAGISDRFELIGAGVGGNKVFDLCQRMEQDVLAKSPEVVVVFIGVNDVWHPRMQGTAPDPDSFAQLYESLLSRLQAKGIRVILATPACIGEKTDGSNDMDEDLNHFAQITRDLTAKYMCGLVDLREAFLRHDSENNPKNLDRGILTTDGVHFSKAGNTLAARRFYHALVSD